MNPRESAVLAAVQRHYARYGVPPTIRYIMRRTNIPSSDTVFYYYKKLVQAKEIVLAGSPGSQRKPVPISIFNLITHPATTPPYCGGAKERGVKETLPNESQN